MPNYTKLTTETPKLALILTLKKFDNSLVFTCELSILNFEHLIEYLIKLKTVFERFEIKID
jgi:hypothetical protein